MKEIKNLKYRSDFNMSMIGPAIGAVTSRVANAAFKKKQTTVAPTSNQFDYNSYLSRNMPQLFNYNNTYANNLNTNAANQNTDYPKLLKGIDISKLSGGLPATNKNANQFSYPDYFKNTNLPISNADKIYSNSDTQNLMYHKNAFMNATTPEDENFHNNAANQIRLKNGYYGGSDGSEFIPVLNMPEYKPYEYEPFEYNASNDEIYKQYAKQFVRQGQAAGENALATTAAATGGIPSSYATAANAQTQQAYAQKTADIIPVLEQNAYNRYQNERDFNYVDYINKYMNDVNYATAKYDSMIGLRDFDYKTYFDNQNQSNWEKEFGLKERQTDFDMDYKNKAFEWDKDTWNQEFSYEKYLKDRNYQLDRDKFNYGVTQDALNRADQEKQRDYERNQANLAANYPSTVMGQLESRDQKEAQLKAEDKEMQKMYDVQAWISRTLGDKNPNMYLSENAYRMTDEEFQTVLKVLKEYGLFK